MAKTTGTAQAKAYAVRVREDRCKACGLCLEFCPKGVLAISRTLNKDGAPYALCQKPQQCVGCLACAVICPEAAIEISETE